MVSSPAVKARRLAPLLTLAVSLWLALPARAQRPEELEPPELLETGTVQAVVGARVISLPYSRTPEGPLFALAPLVTALGGELEPLAGGGVALRVAGSELLLGPDSDKLVVDQTIVALSQRPLLREGSLQVPLDVLERTFGELLGFGFDWLPTDGRLEVQRVRVRELPLIVDAVHIRGTTTVVLQFPDGAPRYRIDESPGRVMVELLGDRALLVEGPPPLDDPLLREIEVTPERIRLEIAAGVGASSYVLRRPFRLVFDLHQESVAASEPSALTPPQPRSGLRTIVIDPGHGGGESGALGKSGAVEKELTLLLAQALKRRLEARLPVRVVLTRREDASLPLETRTAIANQNKADLFISLHLNSSRGDQAQGAETYFLSLQASDQQAAASAQRENQGDGLGPEDGDGGDPLFDLQLILWDLAQSRYLAESQQLAKLIQEELNTTLGLRDRGVKQAPFTVLMGAAMPAVLVELGFLSNPDEEARLQDPSHRAELVEAMARAISRYRAQLEQQEAGAGGEALR